MPEPADPDLEIRDLRPEEDAAMVSLWERCGLTRPWNDPWQDIRRACREPSTRLLVGVIEQRVIASVMVGSDGHRGWIYYLAVDPPHRGHGYGARLIAAAEAYLVEIGCPKLMMMVRSGQPDLLAYYARLGYRSAEAVTLGKRLIADD